jgi:hypothetical protein
VWTGIHKKINIGLKWIMGWFLAGRRPLLNHNGRNHAVPPFPLQRLYFIEESIFKRFSIVYRAVIPTFRRGEILA